METYLVTEVRNVIIVARNLLSMVLFGRQYHIIGEYFVFVLVQHYSKYHKELLMISRKLNRGNFYLRSPIWHSSFAVFSRRMKSLVIIMSLDKVLRNKCELNNIGTWWRKTILFWRCSSLYRVFYRQVSFYCEEVIKPHSMKIYQYKEHRPLDWRSNWIVH